MFVPDGPGRGTADHPGVGKPGLRPAMFRWRRAGAPKFPGNPSDQFALFSRPPALTRNRPFGTTGLTLPDMAPASDNNRGPHPRGLISGAQSQRLLISLVYASQGAVARRHARLAFRARWPQLLPGRDWIPAGFRRKVSSDKRVLLSRASLAQCQFNLRRN